MAQPDVVIVGAGMAGLTAARSLQRRGLRCVVLDKGRAVGGRMATRTIDGRRFDHGAQHFSARDPAFAAEVAAWLAAGVARVWLRTPSRTEPERGVEPRHVGAGGMRRIPEHLAAGLDIRTGVTVDRLDADRERVIALASGSVVASGAMAVVTPPLPQAEALLAASRLAAPPETAAVEYDGCLAVLAGLHGPSGLDDGHAAPDGGPVAWLADNHHKGASPDPAVTIHSTPAFAAAHLEAPPDAWARELCAAAAPLLASEIGDAVGHRWRFSMPHSTLETGWVEVPGAPVLLAGEAFAGARVEGAYLSGRRAADEVASRLGRT